MTPMVRSRFDAQAFLDAVDAQRRARGMPWAESFLYDSVM